MNSFVANVSVNKTKNGYVAVTVLTSGSIAASANKKQNAIQKLINKIPKCYKIVLA